ncbi:RHS repeat-associated core domain-containing protein [Streptomyces sp. NPDC088910]|uniref:RHS repeat-associated core domain-containing protein n=1 Tax=Streptomyces sp. NPDC088910 TaxID=3365911 RepID=UPI00382C3DA4
MSVLVVMALAVEAATVAADSGVAFAAPRSEREGTVASAPSYGVAEARDVLSARLMARLQGRRIEALSERTDASQTFVNADGTVTYTAFAEPKWTQRGGSWVNLDPTLQLRADGSVVPVAAETDLVLSGGGSGPLASLTVDGKNLSLTWPTALPMPVLSGAKATYANVLKDVDLELTASLKGGVEETLVVKSAEAASGPGLSDLVQSVSTSNGVIAATDAGGNLTVTDGTGRLLVNSPAPVMWDSATSTEPAVAGGGNSIAGLAPAEADKAKPRAGTRSTAQGPGSHAHHAAVKTTLKDRKLHLTADRGLLTAKSTVFPVYIDPAYVPHPASGSRLHWNEVQQAYPNTSNYDSSPSNGNGVGYQGFSSPKGIERTYYRVSIPPAIWGGTVLSADMKMTESYSASCGTTSYGVQAWSTNVFDASTTWANAPGKVAQQSSVNFGPACTSSPSGTFSFMNQVTNAAANHWQTICFVLVASSETNEVQFKRFSSAASLSITYNTPPTTPTSLAASPTATDGYAASATPTLSAKATDANSDTVRLDYQVLSGTTVKASGSSAFVNSGTAGTWKVSTALADGSYTWKVRAYDGRDYSAWTAAKSLIIDTTAPANTTVSSSDFPSNVWSGTPDSKGNFSGAFTFAPPTSDVAQVAWTLDSGTWTYTATSGAAFTKTLTFGAGRHVISAKTHDKAGNIATGTSYVFYGGDGAALTAPAPGDRPARRVALTAQGKPNYTGVTYQYRVGETDTWHDVPASHVTKADGTTLAAWPVALTVSNGLATPAPLTWNITDTLGDGPVDVRANFTDGTTPGASPATTITVDRNAGTAPLLSAGPASVNALTGDASLSATDASGFDLTVTRSASSRRPTNGSAQEGQAAIFGPQWTAGTTAEITGSDWSYLRKASDRSVALVDADGDPTGFTAASGGGWKPEPGAEDLTLTGSLLTGTFTLKDSEGTTTTFAKVDPSATTWQVTSTFLPTTNSTTQVVSEKIPVGNTFLARPKYVIAPTSAVTQSTCATTPGTKGCRVLEYVYATATTATASAFGDFTDRVSQIRLWGTDPGASAATAVTVSQYAYDTTGRLRQQWDPRISPSLKTAYDYDSAGRITTLTPPGELQWTFAYGSAGNTATAGDGMLLSASRPTLTPGSATQTNGTASTNLVYDVPLSGGKAPYPMSGGDVTAWGQSDAPSDATALFPSDAVPASHDGAALTANAYQRAIIAYTDASGRQVNTANPGAHITTTEYDRYGHTVRELTAANRELALATDGDSLAEQQQLGIDALPSAERAQLLSTVSVFNTTSVAADAGTNKDTDPANAGQRELEKSGPLHMVTLAKARPATAGGTSLPAGSFAPARAHTVTAYDQGRPTNGTATVTNQPTTVSIGADVHAGDAYTSDGDTRTSTTGYDWTKGLPTTTVTDPAGLNLVRTTAYDAQGRVIKTTLPKSTGTDAGATVTTYWSATGTGACNGRPEWADLLCSTGPASAITGGGTNPSQLPTTTTTYDRWGSAATVTDTAGAYTRTTTTSYDAAGRTTGTSVTGGVGTAVPATTATYDPATGKQATASADGKTITQGYDALGRLISYSDGAGNTATTWYDALDRPIRVTDSAPSTTTYTYDTASDPRGLETGRADSVAGTFNATYDSDGRLATEALPGGYTVTFTRDETGADTSRTYASDNDGLIVTADSATLTVHGQQVTHTTDTGNQAYTYDAAGRLTNIEDVQDATITHRAYAFDKNTNRTSLTTTVDNPDGTAGTPATVNYTYDSADRLSTAGTVYDALGRTTVQATGTTLGYYANDVLQQETIGGKRERWSLDAENRLSLSTVETQQTDGSWTATSSTVSHFGCGCDSPTWSQSGGTIARNVQDLEGRLSAITTATGGVSLQLTDLHGDVTVQLPLDASQSLSVYRYDEFGNAIGTSATPTYGWLGAYERGSDHIGGVMLMGVRAYDPSTGRFLQTDSVPGGNANAYTYPSDPIRSFDLTGQFKVTWGWVSGTIYLNRRETKKAGRAAAAATIVNAASTVLVGSGVGVIAKWVFMNAGTIAVKAQWAYADHKCLKLKWPFGYPGLIPGSYKKGYCK